MIRWLLWGALVVGGIARIDAASRAFPPDRVQRSDVRLYVSTAQSFLEGRGWTPAYPTNFIPPPGQSLFVVGLKLLWPTADYQHLRSVQAVVATGTILLGFTLARSLQGPSAGVVCAWLLALSYPLSELVGYLLPETNFLFALFAAVALLLRALRRESPASFAFAGAALGVACLLKPIPSALPPFLAVFVLARHRSRRGLWLATTLLAGYAIIVLPWIAFNRHRYGHVYPISTNGGVLLALANSPGLDSSSADMIYWDDLYQLSYYRDPYIEWRFRGRVDRDGRPEHNLKDRAYLRKTLDYIVSQPLHFGRNYLHKLFNFLRHPPSELPAPGAPPVPFREIHGLVEVVVLLGLAGLVLLASRWRRPEAGALLVVLGYLLAFGALYHITRDGRMNLPFRALLTVPASVAPIAGLKGIAQRFVRPAKDGALSG